MPIVPEASGAGGGAGGGSGGGSLPFGARFNYGKENQSGTQATTIQGAGAGEQRLLSLLAMLAQGGAGQLGDLSSLASGQVGSPTGADQELIRQSIEQAGQMAQLQMGTIGAQQGAQGREQLASRGVSGSSSEVLSTLLNQLGTQSGINQSILGAQQQGGQALMQLPFQRAQTQLSANQALFDRITGSAQPVMQSLLQGRLAQPTTTTDTETKKLGISGKFGG